jgi:hypothetical protein
VYLMRVSKVAESPETELGSLCEAWPKSASFPLVIKSGLESKLINADDFWNALRVPESVLSRWAKGLSQPHALMQKAAVDLVRSRVPTVG